MEFLGRADTQVKVRGYRIELGEIETQLNSMPGVAEAVVVVIGDSAEEKYLQACVVPAAAPPEPASLAAALGRTLPDYMIPSRIVLVGSLPRTPSGKLDRLAIAASATGR
jgi:D-alanine--poly(phosphoribitol) ligase subunit 1